ncbi:hypothetical protein ACEYYA_02570 [Paracoccus sp. p3-h83]|uniref:hypothetical protein n=1 Tax=Paracoccus sp. p3-h83 TaxID=3342805 RepID=UPI0035B6D605
MTDIPATGGRFSRDPKTGALTPLPDNHEAPAALDAAADTPEPDAAPAPAKSKGKA